MMVFVDRVIALEIVAGNQRPTLGVASVLTARVEKVAVEEQAVS